LLRVNAILQLLYLIHSKGVALSDGSGSKNFDPGWVLVNVLILGLGQFGSATSESGKFPQKIPFFQFILFGSKKSYQGPPLVARPKKELILNTVCTNEVCQAVP